jgi:hypothetical protein
LSGIFILNQSVLTDERLFRDLSVFAADRESGFDSLCYDVPFYEESGEVPPLAPGPGRYLFSGGDKAQLPETVFV